MHEAESSPQLDLYFFFSQGIGFLGLAGCTQSPSAVPACDGAATQAELFAAIAFVLPGHKGSALGANFLKRGYPRDEFGPGRSL